MVSLEQDRNYKVTHTKTRTLATVGRNVPISHKVV